LSSSGWVLISGAISRDYILGFIIINAMFAKSNRVAFLKNGKGGKMHNFNIMGVA
jgi:hypothetical protein